MKKEFFFLFFLKRKDTKKKQGLESRKTFPTELNKLDVMSRDLLYRSVDEISDLSKPQSILVDLSYTFTSRDRTFILVFLLVPPLF